ncbi:MFS transporter [Enterococcus sp.]|uniref:MFS transporter n=1 Tax=Enterococcus sp. TaxID=35783 RepID=UPI0028974C84|nr:MFS transporter [Enterococcus sp.]
MSVSLLVVSAGAIAGNIPAIAQAYPTVNETLVELLTTIPSLLIIVTILISPKVAQRIGYKRTVQVGIGIVCLAGLLPVVTTSFTSLFLSRILFGVGVGLFNPLLYTIAAGLYSGGHLATVIGLQSAFEGIGGMLITFLVGQLLVTGWRYSFMVYGLAIPILFLFGLFVPDIRPTTSNETKAKTGLTIDRTLIYYLILLFLAVTVYMSIAVKVTGLLYDKAIGDATDGSNLLAFIGFGAMTAGMVFGKTVRIFKEWTIPVSFLGMSIALLLLARAPNLWIASLAVILCGFSFRTFVPYVFNEVNQKSQQATAQTALLLIFFNIGTAATPLTIAYLQYLFPFLHQSGLFYGGAVLMLVLGGVVVVGNVGFMIGKNDSRKR